MIEFPEEQCCSNRELIIIFICSAAAVVLWGQRGGRQYGAIWHKQLGHPIVSSFEIPPRSCPGASRSNHFCMQPKLCCRLSGFVLWCWMFCLSDRERNDWSTLTRWRIGYSYSWFTWRDISLPVGFVRLMVLNEARTQPSKWKLIGTKNALNAIRPNPTNKP